MLFSFWSDHINDYDSLLQKVLQILFIIFNITPKLKLFNYQLIKIKIYNFS